MSENIGSNWAFRIMTLIHDNPIRRKFSKPTQVLKQAGLKPGLIVLEVGCGPGFFTIPAARILGDGTLYANDSHPLAIEMIKKKLIKNEITNVELVFTSITNTGLSDESVDLIFLFGVPRMIRNEPFFKEVLDELYRLLRVNGIISIKSSRKNLQLLLENKNLSFLDKENGIYRFEKK